jgi:hypothetical protein
MGLKSSLMIAWRSVSRRKTKNLSAILAVTLGVTLLVGIQITTDTLENSFLTSLLQTEGEVDLRISNATTGAHLKVSDQQLIADLVPEALGIMPELRIRIPALIGSQYDPRMTAVGIPADYPTVFGNFYDWQTGDKIDLNTLLTDNNTILLSSRQAEKLGLTEDTSLPITLTTEFTNLTSVISDPPTVPLSDWMVNANFTTGEYVLDSSSLGLYLELTPVTPFSTVTVFTINAPQLNLSDYAYVNITATGSDNARILLGFSLDDGNTLDIANMTDPQTLNTTTFDLAPYSQQALRGDAYLALMSSNGTQATIQIEEIIFEAPLTNNNFRPRNLQSRPTNSGNFRF